MMKLEWRGRHIDGLGCQMGSDPTVAEYIGLQLLLEEGAVESVFDLSNI